jgi:O-methyltransferase
MQAIDYEQLLGDVKSALATHANATFAIIGHTPLTYDLVAFFRAAGAESRLLGAYSERAGADWAESWHKPLERLTADRPDVAIIASDADKELLLEQTQAYLTPATRILLAGYGHFGFRDPLFDDVVRNALVPSLANGYPNTLIHLYQCLQNAARLGLSGVVAEFGMFKGGTTAMLSRFVEGLGQQWPVIGFDTFAGFPERRSVLDMYDHPDCVFSNEALVRQHVEGQNIEIVSGDIVTTAGRLADEDVVLAFMDTDNFTSAMAALDVIQDRVVVGGAIVFDHFTGRNRFRYTLGERIAAKRLLDDKRYFNLHDTGVFLKQR